MKLTRYKLGDLTEQSDERNSDEIFNADDVVGLSTQKMMIETKADLDGVKMTSYKIFPHNNFGYVADTSRRGNKISLAFNNKGNSFLVSSISTVFKVRETDKLSSDYLFMYFNRPEFDRYSRFNSWGSARETFDWNEMCDIDIELPPIEIQEKYVAIYNAMLKNQQSYERGLEDLKLVCDAYIENLRRDMSCEEIGEYIQEVNERNTLNKNTNIQGVESTGNFCKTKANIRGLNISNYKIVKFSNFAYNPSRINLGSIALNKSESCIVSPMYIVFEVKNKIKLIPEYLMMWFSRSEFQRSTLFYATGSVRDTFDYGAMEGVTIPIPKIEIQQDIVNIYTAYIKRKEINERLKAQIKDICPILIKGSIDEARTLTEV